MPLALHLAVPDDEQAMPAISRHKPEISSLRGNSFGKQLQGHGLGKSVSSAGLNATKDFSLISHIESLKEAAYGNLYPQVASLKNTHDVPYISRILETASLPTAATASVSSKWAVDPGSVEGNLRQSPNQLIKGCTVEDIVSRVSSCTKQSDACEDDEIEIRSGKSRTRSVRGSKKAGRMKDSRSQQHESSTRNNLVPSITVLKDGYNTTGLTVISALCQSIKIHQKSAHKLCVKTTPYQNKSLPNVKNAHRKAVSPARASLSNATNEYLKIKKQPPDHIGKKNGCSDEIVKSKVFLSEKQSGVISDGGLSFPCAPPATPTPDQLRKTEYVPSLQDIRAQRVIKQRLQVLEAKALKKEKKKQEADDKKEKMTLREKRIEKKKKQRQEIYELNRLMTEWENERFVQFMSQVGSNI